MGWVGGVIRARIGPAGWGQVAEGMGLGMYFGGSWLGAGFWHGCGFLGISAAGWLMGDTVSIGLFRHGMGLAYGWHGFAGWVWFFFGYIFGMDPLIGWSGSRRGSFLGRLGRFDSRDVHVVFWGLWDLD